MCRKFPNRIRDRERTLEREPAKEAQRPKKNSSNFSEVLHPLRKIEIDSLPEVLALAIERHLTFYDASYAYIAEKENMRLVTQDTDLLKKCKVAISIKEME